MTDAPVRFILASHGVYSVTREESEEAMALVESDREAAGAFFARMLDEREAVYRRVVLGE